MVTDHPGRSQPVELAPEIIPLPGFDGDAADRFLIPVNACFWGAAIASWWSPAPAWPRGSPPSAR